MLPFIAGAVAIVAVGSYLLDDAKSKNKRARREYDDAYEEAVEWVEHVAFHAQRKDTLDKLFKMKKAKQKVADTIYVELKKVNKDFQTINQTIKASKKALGDLFEQKRATEDRVEKRKFQEGINLIQLSRKEFFGIKDVLVVHQGELRERLKLANREVKMVQNEINDVLDE